MQYSDGCACCSLSAFEVEKTCFLVKYWRSNLRHIQLGPQSQDVDNISVSSNMSIHILLVYDFQAVDTTKMLENHLEPAFIFGLFSTFRQGEFPVLSYFFLAFFNLVFFSKFRIFVYFSLNEE